MIATVGVNLLWLVPGEVGGSEESTVASLTALRELAPPDLDLRLFALRPFAAAHPEVVAAFRTELLGRTGRSRPARIVSESTWLARRTGALDLVHHAGGTLPPVHRTASVLTIHDLQPLEQSATHSVRKRAYLRATVPRSVRAARIVVTPSEFVRRSVISHFDVDPARVVAVPHGVAPPAVTTPPEDVVDRYRLDGPVVLYPAITYPHKDHATLVEAFAAVHDRHPDALLVLPGGAGSAEAEVLALVRSLGLHDSVRRLGRVSAADVAGLYDVATVVAVPSRYEGFGLPAAEAMLHGVALVAADATALPEVVGDAGVLVEPGDVAAWAAAIGELLSDPAARDRLGVAGRERVQRYRWEPNAMALADVYRRALSDG